MTDPVGLGGKRAGTSRPDLLERLRAAAQTLHSAERQAAQAILDDPEWVSGSSIKALAEKAGVSEPTVVRLARKLGCKGYADFKLRLAEDVVVTRVFLSTDALLSDSAPSSVVERMYEAATRTMTETMALLDREAFEKAVRTLARARRVVFCGVGGSSALIAEEGRNRFFRLGMATDAIADPYRQRMAASILAPSDVLVCFSATGKPASVIQSAEIARERGAEVIAVTPRDTALAQAASQLLAINVFNEEVFFNLPSPMRYAQLYLLDCLAAAVAIELGPEALQNLKAIRVTLSTLHGPMKFQPIGD